MSPKSYKDEFDAIRPDATLIDSTLKKMSASRRRGGSWRKQLARAAVLLLIVGGVGAACWQLGVFGNGGGASLSAPPTTSQVPTSETPDPTPTPTSTLPDDPAEALRMVLSTTNDNTATDTLKRVFFNYWQASTSELRYLPDFSATTAPNWDSVMHLVFFFAQTDQNDEGYMTITADEVDRVIASLFAPFEYTHASNEFFTYADGLYTATGWDWGGHMYYNLTSFAAEGDTYTATFDGYEVSESDYLDMQDPDASLSPNMTAFIAEAGSTDNKAIGQAALALFLANRTDELKRSETVTISFTVNPTTPQPLRYTACDRRRVEQQADPETTSTPTQTPPPTSTSTPTPTSTPGGNTASRDDIYIVVNGSFYGAYTANRQWKSTGFTVSQLLSPDNYRIYGKNGNRDTVTEAFIQVSEGLNGYQTTDIPKLTQYGDVADDNYTRFKLPISMDGAAKQIPMPTYNAWIRFVDPKTGNAAALALSAAHNPVPREMQHTSYTTPEGCTDEGARAMVRAKLDSWGFTETPVNVTDMVSGDLRGNGSGSLLIFAGTPSDDNAGKLIRTQAECENGKGGSYALVILVEEGGQANVLFEKHDVYQAGATAGPYVEMEHSYHAVYEGCYDVNGDGVMEFFFTDGEWEWGHSFMYALTGGSWKPVLKHDFGV